VILSPIIGSLIFAFLAAGAVTTYRFTGEEALLIGGQIYAATSLVLVGLALVIAGLPS
jgi:hypothetical protein